MSDYGNAGEVLPLFDDGNLFENPKATTPAKSREHSRSRRNAAYEASKPRHGSQNARVLEYLQSRGSHGATRHEIEQDCGLPLASACRVARALIDAKLCFESKAHRDGKGVVFAKGYC